MKRFRPYVLRLEALLARLRSERSETLQEKAAAALDGQPSDALVSAVPVAHRRAGGTFFTGSELAEKAVTQVSIPKKDGAMVFDPACGAGDLLIATARLLPVSASLHETLASWGNKLAGTDVHATFVRATQVRLALLALTKGAVDDGTRRLQLAKLMPHIRTGNGLRQAPVYKASAVVVMNPPFQQRNAPEEYEFGSGLVTNAAVFMANAIAHTTEGTAISAVLPDVLRTGSRYRRWRDYVEAKCSIHTVQPFGRFNSTVDVDVFLVHLSRDQTPTSSACWWKPAGLSERKTLSSQFDVFVGAVVPHRDPETGPWCAYATANSLPAWGHIAEIAVRRRYSGRVFTPPFVAIRRTSAPSDADRAVATIVTGSRSVAVENHLIVCKPIDGTLQKCRHLLRDLRSETSNAWLNDRIRCRHLTVQAIEQLPITFS